MASLLGVLGLLGFAWLALFQAMLAMGLPLGLMAWGGQHRVLPARQRIGSAMAFCVAVLGFVALAQTDGYVEEIVPNEFLRLSLWVLFALFTLSVLANAMSASRIERLHGVPLAAILAASTASAVFS